jgi:uncharacterized protein YdaU (DUF1376 family)
MKKLRPPAFQLYARDFLTSEKIQLMPLEAVGAYIILLCQAWISDPIGTLPDDDAALARFSRLGERWPEHRDRLRECFHKSNGKIFSARLRDIFLGLKKYHQERSESGKKGATSRWRNDGSANGSANGSAIPHGSAIVSPMAKNGSASASASAFANKSIALPTGVKALIQSFYERLSVALGEKPSSFNGGALGKTFKAALKQGITDKDCETRIQNWFASEDQFVKQNGYAPTLFCQKFPLLRAGPLGSGKVAAAVGSGVDYA